MIIGMGTDIVEVKRIEKLCRRYGEKFLTKILSEEEIAHMPEGNPYGYAAGRFAVKESLVKACGGRDFSFSDIAVLNDREGKPYFADNEKAAALFGVNAERCSLHVSISHEKKYACAVVIAERL